MSILMTANREWASRPNDECFLNLLHLRSYAANDRQHSQNYVRYAETVEAFPEGDGMGDIQLTARGLRGYSCKPSHYAFGQLATTAKAPADYLRSLPAPLVADALNYGLKFRASGQRGFYINEQTKTLKAVTGPSYGRIHNADVVEALIDQVGDGVNGQWKVPGEFSRDVPVTKENTTLYASDRDMFVFLADEANRITIPNRRNGQPGTLARGFFIWNSEVGDRTLGFGRFLFDYVCSNRIVWGATQYAETKIRHTRHAPAQWLAQVKPQILAMANETAKEDERILCEAQAYAPPADKLDEFLANRFGKRIVGAIKAAYEADEKRPMETLWDIVTGATAYARGISYQDHRLEIERAAGDILGELV